MIAIPHTIIIDTTNPLHPDQDGTSHFLGTLDDDDATPAGKNSLIISCWSTGNVLFTGAVGNATINPRPLGELTISSAGSVLVSGSIATAVTGGGNGNVSMSSVSGAITIDNPISAGGSGNISLIGGSISHSATGSLSTVGTGTISVTATSATGDISMANGTTYSAVQVS